MPNSTENLNNGDEELGQREDLMSIAPAENSGLSDEYMQSLEAATVGKALAELKAYDSDIFDREVDHGFFENEHQKQQLEDLYISRAMSHESIIALGPEAIDTLYGMVESGELSDWTFGEYVYEMADARNVEQILEWSTSDRFSRGMSQHYLCKALERIIVESQDSPTEVDLDGIANRMMEHIRVSGENLSRESRGSVYGVLATLHAAGLEKRGLTLQMALDPDFTFEQIEYVKRRVTTEGRPDLQHLFIPSDKIVDAKRTDWAASRQDAMFS